MSLCESCGDPLPGGASFCPRCGVDASDASVTVLWNADAVETTDDASPHAEIEVLRAQEAKRKQALGFALALTVFGGVALLFALASRGNEQANAKTTRGEPTTAASAKELEANVEPPPPEWVVVTVGRVEVAATPPSGGTWDGEIHEATLIGTCKGVASLGPALGPIGSAVGGGMRFLGCGLFFGGSSNQVQSDPRAPDLQLRLRAPGVEYSSYIAFDRTHHNFDYSFLVPVVGLDSTGIVLDVADADNDEHRSIGSTRISPEQLLALASNESYSNMTVESEALRLFEIRVQPATEKPRYRNVELDVSDGFKALELVPVMAGQRVKFKASGQYTVGQWHDQSIGPEGYPGGEARSYNLDFPAFRDAPHGAAVALLGQQGALFPVAVTPCSQFVAPTSGLVWVGLNDSSFSNNSGILKFRVVRRLPTVQQWRSPKKTLRCK